jgi:hypothetical protein
MLVRSFALRGYGTSVATVDDVSALAARLPDVTEGERHTIPHFDGYAAVLIQLGKVAAPALREAITDGWLACAPPALANEYLKEDDR